MTPREAILRMLDHEDDLALYCARAIRSYEGWDVTDGEALHRLRKALRGAANRHFEIDWYPVLQAIFVKHGVPDLVSQITYDARREAEYELRREERQRSMLSVRPERQRGKRSA